MSAHGTNERADEMTRRAAAGETLAVIAKSYGISRQRVHQIIRKRAAERAACANTAT